MKSFYINPTTGDLEFTSKKELKMVEGDDELVQCVDITLKTNKNEWLLNPDHGFNMSVVQQRKYDEAEVTDEIIEAVFQEERIASLEEINFAHDRKTRQLKVDFKCTKDNGELVEGVIS